MDKERQFMKSSLVSWVKTFDDTIESVKDLADGVVFNKIMHEVDPNTYGLSRVAQAVCDEPTLRLQNLQLVVNCIKHFYTVSQKQLVITSLPEVAEIAHEPGGDKSLDELEKLIILLLGCTIHSENNKQLIEHITSNLGPEHQHALVFYIQKITDSTEFVCNFDWTDFTEISKLDLEALCRTAYIYLQKVAKERDYLFDTLVETTQERNFYKDQQNNGPLSNSVTPIVSPQVHPELIELKKQARALHEDIERKNDQLADQEDELKQAKLDIQKLHHEKLELKEEAKAAQAYRDELETLRIQSAKVERLENEVIKYKQKSEDADYLKKRVLELKQQNELVTETKSLLEQKVASLTTRSDTLDDVQMEMASLKAQVEALHQEKQMDMDRIEDLVAQNARFELESKNNQEQIIQLTAELKTERDRFAESMSGSNSESSLSFEMSEANHAQRAKLVRLEKEKKEMDKAIETARHAQAKVAELEKTNKKLYTQSHSDKKEIIKLKEEVEVLKVKASRVDKLQTELSSQRDKLEDATRSQSRLKEVKARNETIMEAKAMLEDQLEDLQAKLDMLEVIQTENAQLKAQMDSINMESSEDHIRIRELMQQNVQLDLENQRFAKKVSDMTLELEHERSKKSGSPAGGKLTVMNSPSRSESDIALKAKIQRLEKELVELESTKENLRHHQAKVTELEKTTKKLNKQTHSDKREIIRLKEEVEVYKTKTSRLERRRSIKMSQSDVTEEVDTVRGKVAELKQQNTLILESKALLEEEVNSYRSKLSNLADLQSENAVLKVRLNNLEQESQEESERMQDLLQENAQLELQKERNANDIDKLTRELDKLRAAAAGNKSGSEVSASSSGPLLSESELATRTKLLRTERDHQELQYDFDMFKKRSEKAALELENTNKKLNTQIHNGRKEIALLKESLKQEKRLNERLNSQLQKSSSVQGANSVDGSSGRMDSEQKMIKELGTKINEAHSQSLAIKEERINQLEKRLEEERSENSSLKEQIKQKEQGISSAASKIESNLKEKNSLLAAQVMDSGHAIDQLRQKIASLQERLEMFEQLNSTLEEEKKTLLLQVNRLLEQNQGLLMRTLEDKDQELEEERVYSDRLSELEREKALLAEKLKNQEKEAMFKEMEIMRRREKKKNPLKRTIVKIKGKLQKGTGRSITFNEDHGLIQPDSSVSSTFSPRTSYVYSGDASPLSSNQSLSSTNSRHSDSYEEIEGGGSAPDVNSAGYVPRGPTTINSSASPVVLRQRKTQSLYNPTPYQMSKMATSPSMLDDKADCISLQEFLEEANKTPNRRKLMEIKRASIITTPDATPRNSMLFSIHQTPSQVNLPDQLELQDFLRKFHQSDETMSIPEVDGEEEGEGLYEEEDEEGDVDSRPFGSITPNETKAFDLTLSNSNTNNNNSNSFVGLARLSPLVLPMPPVAISTAAGPSSDNTNQSTRSSQMSNSSHPPFSMTHPHLHSPPRRYSTEGLLDDPPVCSSNDHDTGAKLTKRKLYNSFMDLTSSVKLMSRGRSLHKSTDDGLNDEEERTNEDALGKSSPKFKTRSKSLVAPEKESNEQLRRRLFGSPKSGERSAASSAQVASQHSQFSKPPSVKNRISTLV